MSTKPMNPSSHSDHAPKICSANTGRMVSSASSKSRPRTLLRKPRMANI